MATKVGESAQPPCLLSWRENRYYVTQFTNFILIVKQNRGECWIAPEGTESTKKFLFNDAESNLTVSTEWFENIGIERLRSHTLGVVRVV